MAYVINDTCVSCGSCAGECPVNAISQGDGKYEIDADACISCGTCAGVCPTGRYQRGLISHVLEEYIKAAALYLRQQLFCYDHFYFTACSHFSQTSSFSQSPRKKTGSGMRRPPPFPCFPAGTDGSSHPAGGTAPRLFHQPPASGSPPLL